MCDVPCDEIVNIPMWDYAKSVWSSREIVMCVQCAIDNEETVQSILKL